MKNDKSDKMAIDIAKTIEEVSHKCLATKCVACKVNDKRVLAKTVLRCRSNLIASSLMDKGYQKQIEGEWKSQEGCNYLVMCTACGYEYTDLVECTNFCGNCGAKMKGGAE